MAALILKAKTKATHKGLFSRNSAGQKKVAQCIYSDEREEPTTKNTLPSNTLIQI